MKIAVNKGYGGYGLSLKALRRYAELKGFLVYFYTRDINGRYVRIDNQNKFKGLGFFAYKKDFGKYPKSFDENERFYDSTIERTDPILIKVIEELGDKASDDSANIKIIDIPDDIEWEIDECDGFEWVYEKRRRW